MDLETLKKKRAIDNGELDPSTEDIQDVSAVLMEHTSYDTTISWLESHYGDEFSPFATDVHLHKLVEDRDLDCYQPPKHYGYYHLRD